MGKTTGFDQVTRAMRLGKLCADRGITAAEGLERAAEARLRHERATAISSSRRDVLRGMGSIAAGTLALPCLALRLRHVRDQLFPLAL